MTMDVPLIRNPSSLADFIGLSSNSEQPITLQLGGCDPSLVGEAAYIAQSFSTFSGFNYHEINLNCGCPSNKAKKAGFGAELMMEPELVREIVHNMTRMACSTDISVKCRLGVIPGKESWSDLIAFVEAVRAGGSRSMVIHARNVHLRGLSPAQNRSVPPLKYDWVHQLVASFPDVAFTLNGGVASFEVAEYHLGKRPDSDGLLVENPVGSIMIGREAYRNPFFFSEVDTRFFGASASSTTSCPHPTRRHVLEAYLDYCEQAHALGVHGSNTCNIIKPLHNFFFSAGGEGEKLYKQKLDMLLKSSGGGKKINRGTPTDDAVELENGFGSGLESEIGGGVEEKGEGGGGEGRRNKSIGQFVCSGSGGNSGGGVVAQLITEAIEGTIPDSFLDQLLIGVD